MGTVTFRLEGDDAGAVRAFLRLSDAERKAELQAKKLGASAKGARNELRQVRRTASGVEQGMKRAANAAVGFLAGFAGVSKVVDLFGQWFGYLEKIRLKMEQIGTESVGTQEKVLKLADQWGDTSEAGLRRATIAAGAVTSAGGLKDISEGAAIVQSVSSNIQASRRTQMQIARSIAMVSGKAGVTAEEAGVMPEFMGAAQMAGTPEQAQQFLAEVDAALKASASLGFGAFSKAGIKGGTALLALGADRQEVLRRMVQSRATSGGSDELAAQQTKRITQAMARESIQGLLSEAAGKDYREMSWTERFSTMGRLWEQAETDRAMRERLTKPGLFEAREQLLFPQFFGAAGREAYRKAGEGIGAADWATVEGQAAAFRESKLGLGRRVALETEMRRAMMSREQFIDQEYGKLAAKIIEEEPEGFAATAFREAATVGHGDEYRNRELRRQLRATGAVPAKGAEPISEDPGLIDRLGTIRTGARASATMLPRAVLERIYSASGGAGSGAVGLGGAIIVNHGDTYNLSERGDQTQAGHGAPAAGVD